MNSTKIQVKKIIKEDDGAPVNSAAGIAGTGGAAGVGNQGEVPGPKGLLFRRKKVKVRGLV
jgi:hypothetical protein